jgi:hypothetical protein
MSSFLSDLAKSLYDKHGDDICQLTIVFPSRRARHYFSRSLAKLLSRPIWQPKYVGIDEFIHAESDLKVADSYRLVVELYKAFSEVKKTDESFDQFYFWGEALLNDFDAIDKYMVEPSTIFRKRALRRLVVLNRGTTRDHFIFLESIPSKRETPKQWLSKSVYFGMGGSATYL